jgi:hypothetical protein
MWDITPFRTIFEEYPKLIQPLMPPGITLELDQGRLVHGRVIAKKEKHFIDWNLVENMARSNTLEGFIGELRASLENLAGFVVRATGTSWPMLNGEVAEFHIEFVADQVSVSLTTASGQHHVLGHLTYQQGKPD